MPQTAKEDRIRDFESSPVRDEEDQSPDETLDSDTQLLSQNADDEEEEPMPGPRENPPGKTAV